MKEDRAKEVEGIIEGTRFFHVQRSGEDFNAAVIRAGEDSHITNEEIEEVLSIQKLRKKKDVATVVPIVAESDAIELAKAG